MAHRPVVLFALIIATGLDMDAPRAAAVLDCAGSPMEAVMMLPAPLSKWCRISCTAYGHVLQGGGNGIWIWPDGSGAVFIPSQLVMSDPEILGNRSYFTKLKFRASEVRSSSKPMPRFAKAWTATRRRPMPIAPISPRFQDE